MSGQEPVCHFVAPVKAERKNKEEKTSRAGLFCQDV